MRELKVDFIMNIFGTFPEILVGHLRFLFANFENTEQNI